MNLIPANNNSVLLAGFWKSSMRKLFGLLIILTASFAVAACFAPTGSIDGGRGKSGDDALWAVPNRILYDLDAVNGEFDSATDLQVFISDRGAVGVVPIKKAQLYIVENPGNTSERKYAINGDGKYLFRSPGRKQVEVEYNGMDTRYSVEVRGTTFGGDDDDFTHIIWF